MQPASPAVALAPLEQLLAGAGRFVMSQPEGQHLLREPLHLRQRHTLGSEVLVERLLASSRVCWPSSSRSRKYSCSLKW